MQNHIPKDEYKNRKFHDLPKTKTDIQIIVTSKKEGDETFKCRWIPYNENTNQPRPGYLGTARIKKGRFAGIGFHAWKNTDAEFIYYKILD